MDHASNELEADDLGYYADGVKRTLTDEQISMFRHSEIYSLIRERQLRKENVEENGEENKALSTHPQSYESPLTDHGEIIGDLEDIRVDTMSSGRKAIVKSIAMKKRKHNSDGDHNWHSTASRRHIRELDDVAQDARFLDYGDGAGTGQVEKHTVPTVSPSRNYVDYSDEIGQEYGSDNKPPEMPKYGKKIWWPSIG